MIGLLIFIRGDMGGLLLKHVCLFLVFFFFLNYVLFFGGFLSESKNRLHGI